MTKSFSSHNDVISSNFLAGFDFCIPNKFAVNTDFYGVRGVVIKKEVDKLTLENPGYIRIGKEQMRLGGVSDPRNQAMMKMFNLINIRERAGTGIPNVFIAWADEELEENAELFYDDKGGTCTAESIRDAYMR